MSLDNGARVGPYEISGLLGKGGMGSVYRARDTRLERTVALKTLNPELSAEAEFRERFVREARAISSLNHPHICTLYDVGQEDQLSFLVMEYIVGDVLSDRLKTKGPMPVVEALECASQVADALDHAHRRGVVHRDLKPSNIVLTKSGAKLLDFGIAKLVRTSSGSATGAPAAQTVTMQGMVVGTLHYMAPEQLQGLEVDGRSDLFALGAVIYEMLVGSRAFDGGSQATITAKIISGEPERMADLATIGPPELERLVRRCLAKDPDERWQTARDLRAEMNWIAERIAGPRTGSAPVTIAAPQPAAPKKRNTLPWVVAAASLALAAVAMTWALMRPKQAGSSAPTVQFEVTAPPGDSLVLDEEVGGSAISPDGKHLALVASRNGRAMLAVRALDSINLKVFDGTEGAAYPFWSPDSQWIGFFSTGKLQKVALAGGAPQALCDVTEPRGASWGPGTIIFAPDDTGPLYRVPDAGGTPQTFTKLNTANHEESHSWPHFLPDGKTFLFLARTTLRQANEIYAARLDKPGEPVKLVASNFRPWYGDGRLLYVRDGTLMAQPFDPEKLAVSGEEKAVLFGVSYHPDSGYAGFSAAANGVLVYRMGGDNKLSLRWMARDGGPPVDAAEQDEYLTARVSPDLKTLVASIVDGDTGLINLWLVDPVRKVRSRLTSEDGLDTSPVWGPKGDQIVFASSPKGTLQVYREPLDGTNNPVLMWASQYPQLPTDWSRDGQWIIYEEDNPQTKRDLWRMPANGAGNPEPLVRTPFNEYQGQLSPDGKWLAYTTDDSGRPEIFVRGVRGQGTPVLVSSAGGSQSRWKGDGSEIYYLSPGGKLMAVPIKLSATGRPDPGTPSALFDLPAPGAGATEYRYDVTPDGRKFLVVTPPGNGQRQVLAVTLNWQRKLR